MPAAAATGGTNQRDGRETTTTTPDETPKAAGRFEQTSGRDEKAEQRGILTALLQRGNRPGVARRIAAALRFGSDSTAAPSGVRQFFLQAAGFGAVEGMHRQQPVTSLAQHRAEIVAAMALLFQGF